MYLWVINVRYDTEDLLCTWGELKYIITPPCDSITAETRLLEELGEGYKIISVDLRSEQILDLR